MAFGVTKRLVFYCIIATLGSVIYGWEVGMLKLVINIITFLFIYYYFLNILKNYKIIYMDIFYEVFIYFYFL